MIKRAVIWLISQYQRFLSPLKRAPSCKYLPTCSEYAKDAVSTHGLARGGGLAFWRILRCNPVSQGGIDPVPPANKPVRADRCHH